MILKVERPPGRLCSSYDINFLNRRSGQGVNCAIGNFLRLNMELHAGSSHRAQCAGVRFIAELNDVANCRVGHVALEVWSG